MKQLTTNSMLLEVRIFLPIFSVSNRTMFELLCRPCSAYKNERIHNLAQTSEIISLPILSLYPFLMGRSTPSLLFHIMIVKLFQVTNGL